MILCFQGCFLFSQSLNDTLHLPQVEVSGNFTLRNDGFKKIRIDSNILVQYLSADLSTILSQHSTVFVKSYGNGSLSTPSFRGTSANHTQVEWNGICINSPMLGQTDLSQIPVSQFESLEILYGAATVARTSGAFGGVINLVSNPDWNNSINVMLAQTLASFNNYTTDACLAIGNQNVQSITKINYSNALNNFPYNNDQTKSTEKLSNAVYVLGGITQEAFFRLSKKDILTARIWYSINNHQIPPITTNTENVHKEEQKDQTIRSMAEWRRSDSNYYFTLRSSMVDQFMRYTLEDNTWNHHSYSWANRFRLVWSGIKKLTIRPGAEYNADWVISDSYNGEKTRSTIGLFAEFNYSVVRWLQLSLVLRQDMIDSKFLPFIPALAIEYKPFKKINLSFSTNLCRNYRYPSLNDLYFEPYGNAELKPETDYAIEAGTVYNFGKKDKGFFLETTLTGYYSKIINQILWKPNSSGLFEPQNISEVHARGVEAGLNLAWNIWRFRFSSSNTWNYCRSTNEKPLFPGDSTMGKQLIYTPVNTFNSTLGVSIIGFYGSYVFSYISERYTSPDNSTYMPGYYLSNIILGKNFQLKKITLSLQLNLNNLFDLDYQSIANRPMPGRNYALMLKFNFRK
ncbi:MAG: TonB-dependent receptor plug domain-containing protein [Bacteroidetes bacterium]|nr:TonB-dependent receptor plug domain-containing protein [Bacteroidota bacterium]